MSKKKEKDNTDLETVSFKVIEAKTRANIAYGILAFCAFFIVTACIYGMWKDEFSGIKDVMIFVLPVVTFILGHYFGGQNKDDKYSHDKTSSGAS